MSTSGNYIKKHIEQRDGYLLQVTVVHRLCSLADAYATALFSMSFEERRRFVRNNPGVGVLELYSDGTLYMNGAFRSFFDTLIIRD
jgi:thiamine biosynthesis lipoprotein